MPFLRNLASNLITLGYGEQGSNLPLKDGEFFNEPFITVPIPEHAPDKLFARIDPYNQLDFDPQQKEIKDSIKKFSSQYALKAVAVGATVGLLRGAALTSLYVAASDTGDDGNFNPWIAATLLATATAGGAALTAEGFFGVIGLGLLGSNIFLGNVSEKAVNLARNTYREAANAVIDVANFSNTSDFLLRNGLRSFPTVSEDFVRISRFFKTERGVLFVVKQSLLERQNVKIPNRRSNALTDLIGDITTRAYNPLGTLAQVGINFIGGHINKQGANPFELSYFAGGRNGYFGDTKSDSFDENKNRLVELTISKIYAQTAKFASKFDISESPNFLISYNGGSGIGAPLGIGKSRIKIWNPTVKKPSWNDNNDDKGLSKNNSVYVFSSDMISKQTGAYTLKNTRIVDDFRQTIRLENEQEKTAIPFTDYAAFNREIKGGSLDKNGYRTSVTTYKGNYVYSKKVFSQNDDGTWIEKIVPVNERVLDPNIPISEDYLTEFDNDIIKLQFTILNSDPNLNLVLPFRAYIENWSDNWKSEWNSIKYIGRANNFYKYGGFSRTMQLSFLIPALSRADMPINYNRLNALLWSIVPDYRGGIMKGTLVDFQLGEYISDKIIINSIDINEIEGMGWDINRDETGRNMGYIPPKSNYETDTDYSFTFSNINEKKYFISGQEAVGQLPKGIKVNMSITPLNIDIVPRWGDSLVGAPYNAWEQDQYQRRMSQVDSYWNKYDESVFNNYVEPSE